MLEFALYKPCILQLHYIIFALLRDLYKSTMFCTRANNGLKHSYFKSVVYNKFVRVVGVCVYILCIRGNIVMLNPCILLWTSVRQYINNKLCHCLTQQC